MNPFARFARQTAFAVALPLAVVGASEVASAQNYRLLQDTERDRNQQYQYLRHEIKEWFLDQVRYMMENESLYLPFDVLQLEEVIWTDELGNPVTVNEALALILGDTMPVIDGAYGDLALGDGMEGAWDEVAGTFEEALGLQIERTNGSLTYYRNAFQALGEQYLIARDRYQYGIESVASEIRSGSLSQTQYKHGASALGVHDAQSIRDIRRLVAMISSIDAASAARVLTEEEARLRSDAADATSAVTSTMMQVIPPAPGPLFGGE